MKTRIFISIVEQSPEAAIAAIREIDHRDAGVEIRVDSFDRQGRRAFDLVSLRSSSTRTMIYTRRSSDGSARLSIEELRSALDAGFDLVDVEIDGGISPEALAPYLDRIILSLHDYSRVPPLDEAIDDMERRGTRQIKIAVTPRSFDEDRCLLACLARRADEGNLTLFGMGVRGLYSRTLAPFMGSRLCFVALDESRTAAPGQLSLGRASEMWDDLPSRPPEYLFAVVGNPAAHSQSPRIHNARFREAGISAAYGIIETDALEDVLDAMERRLPCAPAGLSVTAPFKLDLLTEGQRRAWTISDRATRIGSANTLVDRNGNFYVDNTDILGFDRALQTSTAGSSVAIVGAGGTGRAAAFAAVDRGLEVTIFNRTRERAVDLAKLVGGTGRELSDGGGQAFDIVVDTLPGDADRGFPLKIMKDEGLLVRAAYNSSNAFEEDAGRRGIEVFSPLDLLEAQAEEQSRLFIEAAGGYQ